MGSGIELLSQLLDDITQVVRSSPGEHSYRGGRTNAELRLGWFPPLRGRSRVWGLRILGLGNASMKALEGII